MADFSASLPVAYFIHKLIANSRRRVLWLMNSYPVFFGQKDKGHDPSRT